ncbi:threonine-phosphate decarboxylase CobD [Clostridium sp. DSM 100503]|uniref:threonine-phosphate decarboxylase CobD n=1 Tax=Clostridium sp. DSM 100503 TaxID=2963282 RepID=UPI0021499AF3|nr:threonine-phosphate decarboxylase CobD [Clostridium sp. DSM 100503]MCR1952342.1 threonine-phosphate decarboxylase CobD [Clostridium sp. DSM 100503]
MSKVVHGGNIDELSRKYNLNKEKLIDFSANINPIGINKNVKMEMMKAIDKIERYPDITYYDLKSSISKFEGIEIEDLVLGNGAAEVIFNLVRALNPRKVLIPAPTFGEYEEAVLSVKGRIEYYYLRENNKWNIDEDILNYITEDIDMVFICNPNNPTGNLTNKDIILEIAKKALKTNTIVVIDESFLDFVKDSKNYTIVESLNEYKNIFILKSMTKFFAIPGIRIGYGISKNQDIMKKINDISVPWNVNVIAERAAIVALEEKEYMEDTIKYIEEEKNFLFNELSKIEQINIFRPTVNFIMFKTTEFIDLKEKMLSKNIIIRSCSNYKGLDKNYFRIAVRTREENEKFISTLKEIIK